MNRPLASVMETKFWPSAAWAFVVIAV